ncbi:MAG: hypothetical protein QUU85_08535, partial [Candidatus Eisenbacteria bacterium]|nr:hypothetical protein [Candidatus Eisenbacteria bacterium]
MLRRIRRPLSSKRMGLVLIAASLTSVLSTAPAPAQEPVPLPEIPLTFRSPIAARYAGMGGVSIAVADDQAAGLSNPAGLGLVRQIEFAVGFSRQDGERTIRYLGEEQTVDFGKTRLSNVGFAYPFQTYRGSLVVGLSYGRVGNLDSDFLKAGSGGAVLSEEEGIFEEGGMGAYAATVAFEAARGLLLGATGTILSGSSYRDRTFRYAADDGFRTNRHEITDSDFDAVTGSIGALMTFSRGMRLGLVLHLPENLDFTGTADDVIDGEPDQFDFTDEIDLPYRLGAGLALARQNVVVSAEATYVDWTQIDFAGPVRTRDREYAYRETLDLRIGAEVLLPIQFPLRLRAGYAYLPLPYQLVLTDVVNQSYEKARFDPDRHYLTAGAGMLLGDLVTLDLAYMHGGFTRADKTRAPELFREEAVSYTHLTLPTSS